MINPRVPVDEHIIKMHVNELSDMDWSDISEYQNLSIEFLLEHSNLIDWKRLIICKHVSESVLETFRNRIDWRDVSQYQVLSESFIDKHFDMLDQGLIIQNQILSESFIRSHINTLIRNMTKIVMFQNLSESFIRDFDNDICISLATINQKLSEKFLMNYSDKLDWLLVIIYQDLSESFINSYLNKFLNSKNLMFLYKYQKLSNPPQEIVDDPNNWLYKDKEYKREKVLSSGLYEIDGDYVIAYKATRPLGHSVYNFQYFYKVGNEYRSKADHNISVDNSFGLSAWTKDKAVEYYNRGKLFKVKIHLDDLAALTDDGKLRASKLTILEELETK